MVLNKLIADRSQPIDEGGLQRLSVNVIDTQETDSAGTGNDSKLLTATVTATAATITVVTSRPYILKSTVDAYIEVKQYPNGVTIDDATTSSYPISAGVEYVTYLQAGAQVSNIRASGDGNIFLLPY
jgi:hypothetical protein